MTESEWLTCEQPKRMLFFLDDTGKLAFRGFRLFGVACCNRVYGFLASERGIEIVAKAKRHIELRATDRIWQAVAVAERYVDGEASDSELSAAHLTATAAGADYPPPPPIAIFEGLSGGKGGYFGPTPRDSAIEPWSNTATACIHLTRNSESFLSIERTHLANEFAKFQARRRADYRLRDATSRGIAADVIVTCCAASLALERDESIPLGHLLRESDESIAQCHLLRDIFGNPFCPVTFDPEWRTTTALAIARGAYEERAFDRLPILADALQDASCDNDDILGHLRDTTTPHVRGCWALDLVLGKS